MMKNGRTLITKLIAKNLRNKKHLSVFFWYPLGESLRLGSLVLKAVRYHAEVGGRNTIAFAYPPVRLPFALLILLTQ